MDFSSKLASNSKLTSDKCKKCFENNLYLYCGAGYYKLDFCPKKQTTVTPKGHGASTTANSLQVDLSFKLASNSKLNSNKYKKYLKNNLCLYYGARDYKLDSYPKKQTMVTPKGHGALAAAFKKSLEK